MFCTSAYATCALICAISLFAFIQWQSSRNTPLPEQLQIRALEDAGGALTQRQALLRLERQSARPYYDTGRSEAPIWFDFTLAPDTQQRTPQVVEFPSRHGYSLACWNAADFTLLGSADRFGAAGGMKAVKAGFALDLSELPSVSRFLCRARFIGPARLSVAQWELSDLLRSAREFDRNTGLLDGALATLAVFVLITAAVNREAIYVLFAMWIVFNLRMASLSTGADAEWLGMEVPYNWLLIARPVTIALYNMLTVAWFSTLFRDDLKHVGFKAPLRLAQWTCLPLLVAAFALPYKTFLPLMWIVTAYNVAVLIACLGSILVKTRSRVAIWYGASLAITLAASGYEIVSAAWGLKALIGTVNSVTAALSSSLLAALAIAERIRIEHNQRLAAQQQLQSNFDAMPIGLFTLDLDGTLIRANPALLRMLGLARIPLGRHNWAQYFGTRTWDQLRVLVQAQASGEMHISANAFEASGQSRNFLVKATLAGDRIEGSLQDITEQAKATEELRFLAIKDPLTKVFNRRGIEDLLRKAIAEVGHGRPLALAYLDLDRFKLINDLFGHATGDEVLKQVSARLSNPLSGSQCVGRVGGDEFIVVMADTTIDVATGICRTIVDSVGSPFYRVGDKAFQVRSSIGLIEVGAGTEVKDAISSADRACREAKVRHNGLVVYEKNSAAFSERVNELTLVERLSRDDITDSMFFEMQPIMYLKQPYASHNFEMLLRMKGPDGKLIPAGLLVATAESCGRIGVIDRWVLSTALAWLAENREKLAHTQFVCMNLSGSSLNDEKFLQDAFEILSAHLPVANMLCIEITESVALHDFENTRKFINRLRSYGVKVALDDFGAGYTSFSYLKQLPADLLKIDGSFIARMNSHPANVAIVTAIVDLARNLGMKTIAEWAEDAATVETLHEIGVDYVQGYAISRPRPAADILAADSAGSFVSDEELSSFLQKIPSTAGSPMKQFDLLEGNSGGFH